MKRAILCAVLLGFLGEGVAAAALPGLLPAQAEAEPKKKKKKARRPKRSTLPAEKREAEPPPAPAEPTTEEVEEAKVEAAKQKLELERRKESKVTPGTASRWSNRGAMVPIESLVPLTAPLPARAARSATTVETPGQRLTGEGELLSARLSLSGYHLATKGQDQVFVQGDEYENPLLEAATPRLREGDRSIDFLRARTTMGYHQIAGSDFALRLDAEYRPQISGTRFTDWRINELYASYGLTERRGSKSSLPWGIAFGRLAIREAGYAQADGAALRFRTSSALALGVFGGVTGNPYGYNWNLRTTQVLSTDWITGGAFLGLEASDLIVNLAAALTYANIEGVDLSKVDRVYLFLDASYSISRELNVVVNGWLDMLPGGQLVQNLDATMSWAPVEDLSLSVGAGRFATVTYQLTTGYSYVASGTNIWDPSFGAVVGADGEVIVPYDAVLETTIYNHLRLRGAYRVLREVEASARIDALLRDASAHREALEMAAGRAVEPSALRLLPGASVRYRNPRLFDANLGFTYILDKESQADAAVELGAGRGLFGLYASGDLRYYFGDINAFDGGLSLTYTFRDLFPGTLLVRGMLRYFRENLSLFVPIADQAGISRADDGSISGWNVIPSQESVLGFAGVEWRL